MDKLKKLVVFSVISFCISTFTWQFYPKVVLSFRNVNVVGRYAAGYKRAGGNKIAGSELVVWLAMEPPIS